MIAHITPTPRQRLIALSRASLPFLAGCAVALAARLYTQHAADLPPCEQLPWMRVMVTMMVAICTGGAWLSGRSAFRIWRSGQYPAPGTAVLFRTRVRTGRWAHANACAYFVLSILIAAFLVALLNLFLLSEAGLFVIGLRGCEP